MTLKRSWQITKIPDNGLPYAEAVVAKAALEDLADGCYLVPDLRLRAIADATVTMRYCKDDEFLGGADVIHPCEYMAEIDGEECVCDIVDVRVAIGLNLTTKEDNNG